MKIKNLSIAIILVFVSIYFYPSEVIAFTDQTNSEKKIRENRHFIHFINVCITNFAAEENREKYRSAYSKHFNADIAYLQADYKRTFKTVYMSQKELVVLYENVLKSFYLEDSKNILDKLAPFIIRSKNPRARLYLTLGYRDRTISWTNYTIGDASNPKMYSYKLYKYEEAIKMARRAKRYGFLALFESQNNESRRKIYFELVRMEKEKDNLFFNRFLDLDEKQTIEEIGKTYDEYEAEQKNKKVEGEKKETVFEKRVEKRVRFRNEHRMARFMLNGEFDKAEDIIRKYVDDFNYKIILATFKVMSMKRKDSTDSEGRKDYIPADIDYEKYKVHLQDNYLMLTKDSVLDSFYKDMKVVDYLSEKKDDKDKKNDEKPEKEKKEVEEKKEENKTN